MTAAALALASAGGRCTAAAGLGLAARSPAARAPMPLRRTVAQASGSQLPGRPLAPQKAPASSSAASGGTAAPGGAPAPAAAAAAEAMLEAPASRYFPQLTSFSRYIMPDSEEHQAATLGSSPMARKLRAAVAAAAADAARRPVCVQGEPGLRKHHIAAQVHYGAGERAQELPLCKLDLAANADPAAALFGSDGHSGIVGSLRESGGSLLLVNVHVVPQGPLRERVKGLLREAAAGALPFRILMTTEQPLGDLGVEATHIKVPPLRARPADIKDLAAHYLSVHRTRTTGGESLLLGTPALRQLLSYQYPVNHMELQAIVDRVAIQALAAAGRETAAATADRPAAAAMVVAAPTAAAPALAPPASSSTCGCTGSGGRAKPAKPEGCPGKCASDSPCSGACGCGTGATAAVAAVSQGGCAAAWEDEAVPAAAAAAPCDCEDVELCPSELWFVAEEKDRFRVNLLDVFPTLRDALKTGLFPAGVNARLTPYLYPLLLAALFLGPQDRAHSVGLNLVWSWWWPGIFLLYPLLGRWWCSICPFMVTGDVVQSWRAKLLPDVKFMKWPKQLAEEQGPWFVVGLFTAILIWEDVWHLNDHAALTGWLLALITGGAVASGLLFPKRFWCRYLCPVGGMNGLFAKLSATELRSQSGVCSSECSSYSCLKGRPDGQQMGDVPNGCPYGAHSNSMLDNSLCSLCTTCVAMCPHDNVELRLRPPGIDLWTLPHTSAAEVSLLFVLMGSIFLHSEERVLAMLHLDPSLLDNQLAFCGIAAATLVAPGLLLWAAHSAVITGRLSALPVGGFWSLLASGSWHGSEGGSGSGSGDSGSGSAAATATPFIKLAYSYVPLVWATTLAFHSEFMLREAGTLLQVGAASLGMLPDAVPGFQVHPAVVAFIQGSLMLLGFGGSLLLLGEYSGSFKPATSKRRQRCNVRLMEHAGILAVAAACLWAVVLD